MKGKAHKPVEWIILASVFFMILPISDFLHKRIGMSGITAVLISAVFLIGIAMFFYEQFIVVDEIIIKIMSFRFLREFVFLAFLLYGLVITVFATLYSIAAFFSETDISYFQWFYFSVITLTTVGYGDITPTNTFMKLLVSMESFLGYISPSIVFTVGLGLILKENKI